MKAIIGSFVVLSGTYQLYQFKYGKYSSDSFIVEKNIPSQKIYACQIEGSYLKSEYLFNQFCKDLLEKNLYGNYFKIQLEDPLQRSTNTKYIIGIIEDEINKNDIQRNINKFEIIKEIPDQQVVSSTLSFVNKKQLWCYIQLEKIVKQHIQKFVDQNVNNPKFDGIKPYRQIKNVLLSYGYEVVYSEFQYPFGKNAMIWDKLIEDK